jgi:hypothetical protein
MHLQLYICGTLNIYYGFKQYYSIISQNLNKPITISKTTAFWDIAPCSLVEIDRRFRGAAPIIRAMIPRNAVIFILVAVRA